MATSTNAPNYQHYRASTIGSALSDVLDSYVSAGHITSVLANRIMRHFDVSVNEQFREMDENGGPYATIMGDMPTYRSVDNVWTFMLRDAEIVFEGTHTGSIENIDLINIIATESKN